MSHQHCELTDIFKSAYLLCRGADLEGIRMRAMGKRIAWFRISGEHLEELDREYRSGQALVNPLQFRECLNQLRDRLFETLRDEKTRTMRTRKEQTPCHASQKKRSSV